MVKLITFIENNCITGKPYIPCGSGSYISVDGRLGIEKLKLLAEDRINKSKNIHKFIGYQIRVGNIKNNHVIYNSDPQFKNIDW